MADARAQVDFVVRMNRRMAEFTKLYRWMIRRGLDFDGTLGKYERRVARARGRSRRNAARRRKHGRPR